MFSEPEGAFLPMTEEAAQEIKLCWFDELFAASVGTSSVDVDYFEYMQTVLEMRM